MCVRIALKLAATGVGSPPQIALRPQGGDAYMKERVARLELELQEARKRAVDTRTDATVVSREGLVVVTPGQVLLL
jgi:hypothetical protein